MRTVVELAALAGAVFVLLAGIGVLRLPDIYTRMHAATKVTTLGIALIGVAAAIAIDDVRAKPLTAIFFIFVTGPASAHFIGRAAYWAENISIELQGPDDLAELVDQHEDTDP